MATASSIEWTEMTWNPVTGCTKVSPGCKYCYAELLAKRLKAMGAGGYENGFEVTLQADRLDQPRRRKKSTMYFVNSMSDLFHELVPFSFIDRVFDVIRSTPQHTFQILTKRAPRMATYFLARECPPNAWIGVSVENRAHGFPRIDVLRSISAEVRFLSIEPLLEDLGKIDLSGIDWVIVGGESGRNARSMKSEWAESIQEQAAQAGVAFFFKQWGTWGSDGMKRSKAKNGRVLRNATFSELPKKAELPMGS